MVAKTKGQTGTDDEVSVLAGNEIRGGYDIIAPFSSNDVSKFRFELP